MQKTRKQLTLFINEPLGIIEKIRAQYNPVQYQLIPAHITLCREDEIEPLESIIHRLRTITLDGPINVKLERLERSEDGKGVFLSSLTENKEFKNLRKLVLNTNRLKKEQRPHITLMHPRNSTCSEQIFKKICQFNIPSSFECGRVSLIEQINDGKWKVLHEFGIVKKYS